ncbi:MAG: sugar phosphate isomerase/epimerase [Spirochaetaceae bacterium]|nr:MAG: sugar phosphate isomerase/epimerase [Spirochaetaceae bacterium]
MKNNIKLSLNAFSFNAVLNGGALSLDGLLEFASEQKFAGIDLTAYYVPGYPEVPKDQVLYEIKRKAALLGLHISGTGVRNDFTVEDATKRHKDVQLVKDWTIAASKLGAPIMRIFSGTQPVAPSNWATVAERMVGDIKECVAFGADHGVIVALQNHNDFIQTAEHVDFFIERVGSPWFGLVLDIGSYSRLDPYDEIARNVRHAVSWQIKEKVNHFGEPKDVDLSRIAEIIGESEYHGYLLVETLGPGDPHEKVRAFSESVRGAFGSNLSV